MAQPVYQIVADGTAITSAIADRLVELTITDEAGIESDRLSMTLDDRTRRDGAKAELPMPGTTLEVHLSYKDRTTWVPMGLYIVDEIELSSPPATLSLTAKAADMIGPFRAPKTRSWHETTLGALITAMAGEHGYEPRIDPSSPRLRSHTWTRPKSRICRCSRACPSSTMRWPSRWPGAWCLPGAGWPRRPRARRCRWWPWIWSASPPGASSPMRA